MRRVRDVNILLVDFEWGIPHLYGLIDTTALLPRLLLHHTATPDRMGVNPRAQLWDVSLSLPLPIMPNLHDGSYPALQQARQMHGLLHHRHHLTHTPRMYFSSHA